MKTLKTILAVIGMAPIVAIPAWAGQCYDVSKGEPKALTGILDYVMFAGPPNFENVQKGDTPEPAYVLRLPNSICIIGDEFAEPEKQFNGVQLVETQAVAGRLKKFLRQQVTLRLKDQMAAETGHHHEPLVAWVTAISLSNRPMDFTDEYGTDATVIRAFYAALRDGQGDVASQMVVAEKRREGPFAPAELTRFYGQLKEPIKLVDISVSGADEYTVHYRFATSLSSCDGRALVKTVAREGQSYILSIRALNGC